MSVTLLLDDDMDISRGDLICRPNNQPTAAQDIEAHGVLDDRRPAARAAHPADRQAHHAHRQGRSSPTCTTGSTSTRCTGTRRATQLGLNEIGRVRLRLTQPVFADPYARNRMTGGMILIDEATNTTVGTVMITEAR